jgi:diacylglycerol kinase (ATP)
VSSRPLLKSFNWAIEGLVYAVRTQRNMRVHMAAAASVFLAAVLLRVSRLELLALLVTVGVVLVAELMNTAIEASIDLVATTYDPLAKIAKDVAAGAVFVSSIVAIAVGYLVFFDRVNPFASRAVTTVLAAPVHVTMLALFVTGAMVIAIKAYLRSATGKGTFIRGGMPSGHVAAAGALFTAITLISRNALVATLGAVLVGLIAQSRIEAGFHSFAETIAGGVLGVLVTVLLFQFFGVR